MALKIVFAGTAEFAIPALQALLTSEHVICAVYTTPDKPAGRGRKLTPSPIKSFAIEHDLPIYQPTTLKDTREQQKLQNLHADIMIDVAYGLFLPQAVLDLFPHGCINIHPSLLPRWRGAAPIPRAILAGDEEIGVTIMQVDAGWDTGPILKQQKAKLHGDETTASLSEILAALGTELLLTTLKDIEAGKLSVIPQDDKLSCYADKITKEEARLNWQLSAVQLHRMIRAFNPWPIAFTSIADQHNVRIWQAQALTDGSDKLPGAIVKATKNGIDIASKNGILRIQKLQLPGGKILTAQEILNAKQELFKVGNIFNA